ncbi:gp53-like domain-containing protein [Paraburkholderia sp. J12]|uniref:gp53-like domain-containing protein n=1 Tax=Paraburkholderia sp. J12 TaxID=2805432 RepID=UPI002ABD3785|nr:hypothetical protein [Paraburkholderia sp. J12]
MSLASNLAALGRLLTAAATGIVNGTTPALGDNSTALATTAWMKAEQAAETVQGTAKVATQAIANAGTDDTTIVTPKKLRAGFSISLGQAGYIAFPTWMGGLIIQWGVSPASSATATVVATYPVAFPNGCFAMVMSDSGVAGYSYGPTAWVGAKTAFQVVVKQGATQVGSGTGIFVAFGY